MRLESVATCQVTCDDFTKKIRLVLLCFVVVGQNSPFKISRRSEKVGIDLSHFMLCFLYFLTIFDKKASEYLIEDKRLIKLNFCLQNSDFFLFLKLFLRYESISIHCLPIGQAIFGKLV